MGHQIRDGFALPATLLALVVVGALVTGGVYVAMEHDRGSVNGEMGQYAFLAAERGLEDAVGSLRRAYFDGIPVGTADTIGPVSITLDDVQAEYEVYVQRLNTRVYNIESEGTVTSGGRYAGSSRRLAQLVRTLYTSFPMDRAVTTHIPMRMVGKSGATGADSIPENWNGCPPGTGMQTGVVSKVPTTDVKIVGAAGITGDPEKVQDASLTKESFEKYGDMELMDLAAVANITLAPGNYNGMAPMETADGKCDSSQQLNWGDPEDATGVCHYYWPIIYSPGDLHINSGTGQGILIVGGDLEIGGYLEFHGLVFVYGGLKVVGSGNKVVGSISVLGESAVEAEVDNTGAGSTVLQLSSCAIERAYRYSDRFARPYPLTERKFVDVTGLGID